MNLANAYAGLFRVPTIWGALAGTCLLFAQPDGSSGPTSDAALNFANPAIHPYADPAGGREPYAYAAATVNESRLYDFYRRQARFYRNAETVPTILPAFPGLDGGAFGHWGKHHDMGRIEDRWSRLQLGPVLGAVLEIGGSTIPKALCVQLDARGQLATVFDPLSLTYRAVWRGGYLQHSSSRWGLMGNPRPAGTLLWQLPARSLHEGDDYLGYHLHGADVVFSYRINNQLVRDLPRGRVTANTAWFTRLVEFPAGATQLRLPLLSDPGDGDATTATPHVYRFKTNDGRDFQVRADLSASSATEARLVIENGLLALHVSTAAAGDVLRIVTAVSDGDFPPEGSAPTEPVRDLKPSTLLDGGPTQWPHSITLPGALGRSNSGYAIDTLGVPLGNPYSSPMFLTGIAFFPDGDAAVSTFFGDVWIVSQVDHLLKNVRWRRFATGLHQPLGIEIMNGRVHTIGRDQITVLHDLNGDGEADHYENFFNRFETRQGSHEYNTGLQHDDAGNLYFASAHKGVLRVSPEGQAVSVVASGLRNPNGLSVTPGGRVFTSAQEGDWTPASMIIEATPRSFFGHVSPGSTPQTDPPLAYVPRGIDNSTGAPVFVTSENWGPVQGQLVGLSYGYGSHYLVLRGPESPPAQHAVVPLPGEFLSGVHRGRFSPVDGQLYTVGTQGWGNYAQFDGSLQRVRYTGEPIRHPIGFGVFTNGIRVDFDHPLDPANASSRERYFCQQWNYRYSPGYGSPEYSLKHPASIGHDPVPIHAAHLLKNRKSLFLEIPDLRAAMVTHLQLSLGFADGESYETELFATALQLTETFSGIDGLLPATGGNAKILRIENLISHPEPAPAERTRGSGRIVTLRANPGMRYSPNSITAYAGEQLTVRLENRDSMPHNWILGDSGGYLKLGEIADAQITAPRFAARGYVPDSPLVLSGMPIVSPGENGEISFTVPTRPGTYPYLCTFPGHWRIMTGTLMVY